MAKNSIEIKLESTSSNEDPKVVKHDAFGRREQIRESEEKNPVQAVSATEEKVENVVNAAEAVVATAKKELEERAAEARADLPQAARLDSENLPQAIRIDDEVVPHSSSSVSSRRKESDPDASLSSAFSEEIETFEDLPRSAPVSERPVRWKGTPEPEQQQVVSFQGSEDLPQATRVPQAVELESDNLPQAVSLRPQSVTALDTEQREDPLSDIATDRSKIESVLGDIDENTDELEELTEDDLKSRSVQAVSALDKEQEGGPLAGGGDDGKGGRPTAVGDEEDPEKKKGVLSLIGRGLDKFREKIDEKKDSPMTGQRVKGFLSVVSKMTAAISFSIKAFSALDNALQSMTKEIQNFAPEIILEKVDRNLMLLEKRMERAGTLGGSFAEMEQERTRLLTVVEDIKTIFASVAVPLMELVFNIVSDILEFLMKLWEFAVDVLTQLISMLTEVIDELFGWIPWVSEGADAVRKALDNIEKNTRKDKKDPAWEHMDRVMTLLVGKGTNVPGFNRGGGVGGPPGSIASGL